MTSLELSVALTIVGTVAGAIGRIATGEADRSRVVAAQGAVLDAYRLGHSLASALGRPAEVLVTADSILVRSIGAVDTIVARRAAGPAAGGVDISPRVHSTRFSPTGLAVGAANVTHLFTRGGVTRQVIVSRLGRIRTA